MTIKIPPSQIVIRPPVEAYSVLIPVTGGCSWNKCEFCGTYKGIYGTIQEYALRPIEDVLKELVTMINDNPPPWIKRIMHIETTEDPRLERWKTE